MHNVELYDKKVGGSHRKKFGQFFTPPAVAKFMADWVLQSGAASLYDPAFGLGAFYEASLDTHRNIDFTASEIDPRIIDFWKGHNGETNFIKTEDYLLSWGRKHKNIVCNPPYMRFQKFLNRDEVGNAFKRELSLELSGYTNTASAFLLKSISELDRSGRLAYIMPLEFLNTGYGSFVKEKLISSGHLVSIISFNCEKDIFSDATTSVGIILYDNKEQYSSVSFYSINSIDELQNLSAISPTKLIATCDLNPFTKWLPYFRQTEIMVNSALMVTLDYYGRFSRGIATGANEYFLLKPMLARERSLEKSECVPCISKSSQVRKTIFKQLDFDELLKNNSSVLLFSVNGDHSEAAEKYIQYGIANKFNERFLTKHRSPWYKTEKRDPASLLLGVFSRGGYKIILNQSKALNLTCYHGFQPNIFGFDQVKRLFLYFMSKTGREIISLAIRKYGDDLDKFEPNDLNGALVPSPDFFQGLSEQMVQDALSFVDKTDQLPEEIESFFEPLIISNKRVLALYS